jgi:cell division protein FtsQ
LLYPLGVRIRDLVLNERGAWTMTLTNGAEVRLGRDHVLERLRRLVVFLESDYAEQITNIGSIDLRYRNGIAVAPRADLTAGEESEKVVAL